MKKLGAFFRILSATPGFEHLDTVKKLQDKAYG